MGLKNMIDRSDVMILKIPSNFNPVKLVNSRIDHHKPPRTWEGRRNISHCCQCRVANAKKLSRNNTS